MKKICLIHSKEINHKKGSWLNKRVKNVLNNVNYVVANSNFTRNLAIDLGVISEKIIVINPGIDPVQKIPDKDFKKAEEIFGEKKNRLITVSRIEKEKIMKKLLWP